MQEFPLSEQVNERVGSNWMAIGIVIALGATFWWLIRKEKAQGPQKYIEPLKPAPPISCG